MVRDVSESVGFELRLDRVRLEERHGRCVPKSAQPPGESTGSPGRWKLQQHDSTGIPQHASHLYERSILVLHMMEGNHRDDAVERAIRERDRLRATVLESDRGAQLPTQGHLPRVRLEHHNLTAAGRKPFRRGTRPTADIEKPEAG